MWYKIGVDRFLLRTGKLAGLLAVCLVFIQILLALKISLLDKLIGLDKVYRLHQINGYSIVILGVFHSLLILLPEGLATFPLGKKYWPEMLGMLSLFMLFTMVLSAQWKKKLLPYHLWRQIHRFCGYAVVPTLVIHIFFVSDSFEATIPQYGLLIIFFSLIMSVILIKTYHNLRSSRGYTIQSVDRASSDVWHITVHSPHPYFHMPGQFCYVTVKSENVSPEPHPFSIGACSSDLSELHFYIKCSGDWTQSLESIKTGAQVKLLGPFGMFTFLTKKKNPNIIFIAAGIGITPMLSMLNYLSQNSRKHKRILLIWCLRKKEDNFLAEQLDGLSHQLSNLKIEMVYSREGGGRLTKEKLHSILRDYPVSSQCYLCGPGAMISEMSYSLRTLGYSHNTIFHEKFSL